MNLKQMIAEAEARGEVVPELLKTHPELFPDEPLPLSPEDMAWGQRLAELIASGSGA